MMNNDEPMKNRVIRVQDGLWEAAKTQADIDCKPLAHIVREFLMGYGSAHIDHREVGVDAPVPSDCLTNPEYRDRYLIENFRNECLPAARKCAALKNREVVEGTDTLKLTDRLVKFQRGRGGPMEVPDPSLRVMEYRIDTVPSPRRGRSMVLDMRGMLVTK